MAFGQPYYMLVKVVAFFALSLRASLYDANASNPPNHGHLDSECRRNRRS